MKPDIHPAYVETVVTCTCGNTFTTRSTAPNDAANFPVFRCIAEELAEDADSGAFEGIAFQRGGISARDLPPAGRRNRIGRVVPHRRVEDDRDVRDGSGHRPPGILCVAERDDARSTRKACGWPQADTFRCLWGY